MAKHGQSKHFLAKGGFLLKNFSQKLHTAARDAGFNRASMAKAVNVGDGTVGRWWRGDLFPDAIELKMYAEKTGKPIAWFYDIEGAAEPTETITISKKEYDDLRDAAIKERARADQLEKLYKDAMGTKNKKPKQGP